MLSYTIYSSRKDAEWGDVCVCACAGAHRNVYACVLREYCMNGTLHQSYCSILFADKLIN